MARSERRALRIMSAYRKDGYRPCRLPEINLRARRDLAN